MNRIQVAKELVKIANGMGTWSKSDSKEYVKLINQLANQAEELFLKAYKQHKPKGENGYIPQDEFIYDCVSSLKNRLK